MPDSTKHQYIPMCRVGLCHIGDAGEPTFEHSYFSPCWNMPPCGSHSTENMAPVTADLFLFFCSMCNMQWVGSTLSMSRYLLKYMAQSNEGNRIEALANVLTGAVNVGLVFVHNTKISSSAINEMKQNRKVGPSINHLEDTLGLRNSFGLFLVMVK